MGSAPHKESAFTVCSIPTIYRSRLFRSRLEARWAAFFDLAGWRYEYEPVDLPGWFPDFSLFGAEEILVEVKPYSKLDQFDTAKIERAMAGTAKQNLEVLLLGESIRCEDRYLPQLGWLWERYGGNTWAGALFHELGGLGFCHEPGSYSNRITGQYDGDRGMGADASHILNLWNEAGNIVQWKPPVHEVAR
jgi:hypothetical protein